MKLENKIMLITYADSMGKNLKELHEVLNKHYKGAIGGVHILPFFPSSADRGFAPMCYDKVDEKFGDFSDIEELLLREARCRLVHNVHKVHNDSYRG